MESADFDLARRAGQGDPAAFQELIDLYADSLYGLALSLVGNAPDAEDLVQETFAGALEGLKRFEGRSSVKTWLVRVLVKRSARHHRSRYRRRMASIDEVPDSPKAGPTRGAADGFELRADVAAALDSLSDEHRRVVVLREFEGMSYDEIAHTLGVPKGTVESRLHRARQELKERLSDYLP